MLLQRWVAGWRRLGDSRRNEECRSTGWIIRNETPLPVVCFSHPVIQSGILTTGKILKGIYAHCKVWISDVVLGGRERVLRACITSFRSDESEYRMSDRRIGTFTPHVNGYQISLKYLKV